MESALIRWFRQHFFVLAGVVSWRMVSRLHARTRSRVSPPFFLYTHAKGGVVVVLFFSCRYCGRHFSLRQSEMHTLQPPFRFQDCVYDFVASTEELFN